MKTVVNRMWLQLIISACLCLPRPSLAACRVYASTWERRPSLVMENDLIRVTVLPDSNGSITEYFLKQPGFNVIKPVRNTRFALTRDVEISDSNFGGYKDWLLESGVLKSECKYTCRVVADSPEAVSIAAVYSTNVKLERIMTIREGSTLVDILATVSNISTAPLTYSYWAHTLIEPAGHINNREVFYMPVGAHSVSPRRNTNLDSPVATVAAITNTDNASDSVSFLPRQGWKAVVSPDQQVVYGEIFPLAQIGSDGYCDFWKGQENMELGNPTSLLTAETVYSARTLAPGDSITLNLAMFQAMGFRGVSYASSNLCLHVRAKTIRVKKEDLVVEVGAPSICPGLELGFALTDDAGQPVAATGTQNVDLGPDRAAVLTFKTDGLSVPAGKYGLHCVLRDKNGRELESAQLLGVEMIVD